jgi:SNF2 family DNA or RNA helicase
MGSAFIGARPRAGLFFDMGLGKTATVLTTLQPEHLPVLVVAPKRVAEQVWHKEGRKWRPDLRVSTAAGSKAARDRALRTQADVYVISRDNLGDIGKRHPYKTVVLDELSSFKNRNTARWRAARAICKQATTVWGLTGTPAPNGLIDLWAQIYLLDGGERLGKNITAYRQRYFMAGRQLPNGVITEWIPRPEAPVRIHRLLEDLCISVEAAGHLDLPPVTFNTVEVPLDPATRRIYKQLKKDLVLDLGILGGSKHIASTAAALSTKLAQITAGFLYAHDEDTGLKIGVDTLHSNKIGAVREIIEGTGSPIVCFYRFEEERDALLRAFPDEAHTVNEKGIWDSWDLGRIPLLVAHPASIGHGLNLQHGGHTAIWTTLPWSLEEWEQSNKRLARQGQKHPVMIHVLTSPGTVDEAVRQALVAKADVQQALLDHLESPL